MMMMIIIVVIVIVISHVISSRVRVAVQLSPLPFYICGFKACGGYSCVAWLAEPLPPQPISYKLKAALGHRQANVDPIREILRPGCWLHSRKPTAQRESRVDTEQYSKQVLSMGNESCCRVNGYLTQWDRLGYTVGAMMVRYHWAESFLSQVPCKGFAQGNQQPHICDQDEPLT